MPRLNLTEDETRALILERAHELFVEIGFNKTTVADIAKACGFSSASVYRHFASKSEINEACCDMMLSAKLVEAREAIDSQASASDKLRAFITTIHQRTLETFTDDAKIHEAVAAAIEEDWQAIRRYRVSLLGLMTEVIRTGMEQGEFQVADLERTARGLHMMMARAFHPIIVTEFIDSADGGEVEMMLEIALRALTAVPTH